MYSPKAIRISTNGYGNILRSTRLDDLATAYINTPGTLTLYAPAGTANNPILLAPHKTTTVVLSPEYPTYTYNEPYYDPDTFEKISDTSTYIAPNIYIRDTNTVNNTPSNNAKIDVELSEGNITVDKKLFAPTGDIKLQTSNGKLNINQSVFTESGDITLTAGSDQYEKNQSNIKFGDSSSAVSGGKIFINERNGDVYLDDFIDNKGLYVKISEKGSQLWRIPGLGGGDDVDDDDFSGDDDVNVYVPDDDNNNGNNNGGGDYTPINVIDNKPAIDDEIMKIIDAFRNGKSFGRNTSSNVIYTPIRNGGLYLDLDNNNGVAFISSPDTSNATVNFGGTTFPNFYTDNYNFDTIGTMNAIGYRLTRNYFERRFMPAWRNNEFMNINLVSDFNLWKIQNATEDELTIN